MWHEPDTQRVSRDLKPWLLYAIYCMQFVADVVTCAINCMQFFACNLLQGCYNNCTIILDVVTCAIFVSDIAIFVLKRGVKLQLTN